MVLIQNYSEFLKLKKLFQTHIIVRKEKIRKRQITRIMATGYVYDERMLFHRDPDDDHPERPERISSIIRRFSASGLLALCEHVRLEDEQDAHIFTSQDKVSYSVKKYESRPHNNIQPYLEEKKIKTECDIKQTIPNKDLDEIQLESDDLKFNEIKNGHKPFTRSKKLSGNELSSGNESSTEIEYSNLKVEQSTGLISKLDRVKPENKKIKNELFLKALQSVHSSKLIEFVLNQIPPTIDDCCNIAREMNSLYLCPRSGEAALIAAECTIEIASRIANGSLKNGFAVVRPPGHHAEPDRAMGFCILNNVAIAVGALKQQGLAKRILVVDWDIHHGNGTQRAFVNESSVLYISLHRHDGGNFYPGGIEGNPSFVGTGAGAGYSVNIGWDGPGVTDSDYCAAFSNVLLPIAREFDPDFIFISAGFDAAAGDPIGQCQVTPAGFAQMTHDLLSLAKGKILIVLEGGYNIPVIARCAEACLRSLLGHPIPNLNIEECYPEWSDLESDSDTCSSSSEPSLFSLKSRVEPFNGNFNHPNHRTSVEVEVIKNSDIPPSHHDDVETATKARRSPLQKPTDPVQNNSETFIEKISLSDKVTTNSSSSESRRARSPTRNDRLSTRRIKPPPMPPNSHLKGPSASALAAIRATIKSQAPYWKALRPKPILTEDLENGSTFKAHDLISVFWRHLCNTRLGLETVSSRTLAKLGTYMEHLDNDNEEKSEDMIESATFLENPISECLRVSSNVIALQKGSLGNQKPIECIIVFAHENGTIYSGDYGPATNNIQSPESTFGCFPFLGLIEDTMQKLKGKSFGIIDLCVPPRTWRLKQTRPSATSAEISALNDFFLAFWDCFLGGKRLATIPVIFVVSGLPAYPLINLIEKRKNTTTQVIRGVFVISPTLYLPVIGDPEIATWYQENSLVIVPARKAAGTPITANASFGKCLSSGCEDPLKFDSVINAHRERVCNFIWDRLFSPFSQEDGQLKFMEKRKNSILGKRMTVNID